MQNIWNETKATKPPVKGWYLGFMGDNARYRADNDTRTNDMRVVYWNGSKFPYTNHYHEVTHWMELPEEPKETNEK